MRIASFFCSILLVFLLACNDSIDIVGNSYKLDSVVLYKNTFREFQYDSVIHPWVFESETLHFGDDKVITSETVENGKKIVRQGFYLIQYDTLIVYITDTKGNKEKIFRLDENSFYAIMEMKISKEISDYNYLYYSKIK